MTLIADPIVEIRDGGAPFDAANGRTRGARRHGVKTEAARRARYA